MQFTHVIISLIFPLASSSSASTETNSDIFDTDEPSSPSFDLDLFSLPNADLINTNLDNDSSSSSINFPPNPELTTNANNANNAITSCPSSSSSPQTPPLTTDDQQQLQTRSSPTTTKKCLNPLAGQNPTSDIFSHINTILDEEALKEFSNDYTIPWTEPNREVCPYERYGYRALPLCDSGDEYDIVEDGGSWNVDLVNPSVYYSPCLTSIEQGWCCEFCIYQAGIRSRRTNYQEIESYWTAQDCWRFDSLSIDTQLQQPWLPL